MSKDTPATSSGNPPAATPENIEKFYSDVSPQEWAEILGPELHYHFGTYEGDEDLQTAAQNTIRRYYPYIPDGARVLDAGCGWGGPARLLQREKKCKVKGLTISTTQIDYCRKLGLDVEEANLETYTPTEKYDVIFMCESLDHIKDKLGLLRRLRPYAPRLIIRASAVATDEMAAQPSPFLLHLTTPARLDAIVQEAGWKIILSENRRKYAFRTMVQWKANLDRVYGDKTPPGQLGTLRWLVDMGVANPEVCLNLWPVMDVIAE